MGEGRRRILSCFCLAEVCLCLLQLLPVKEIDGSTSQDIFTILNIGECIHLASFPDFMGVCGLGMRLENTSVLE